MNSDVEERKIGGVTVRIDRGSCIASESCVSMAPDLFELDDQEIITFRDDAPNDANKDYVVDACSVCPVDVFTVIDDDGNELVP